MVVCFVIWFIAGVYFAGGILAGLGLAASELGVWGIAALAAVLVGAAYAAVHLYTRESRGQPQREPSGGPRKPPPAAEVLRNLRLPPG